jgi:hypothetical protein
MRVASFGIAAFCLLAAAVSLAGPPKLPAAVAKDLKEAAMICTEVGGKPDPSNAVTVVDLNGDGNDDYVFGGAMPCEGAASVYGDREKGVIVYVGDGAGGARRSFDGWAYDIEIDRKGPAPRLWLTVSGGDCGKPPAKDFASENFCHRPVVWNPKSNAFEFGPVSAVRMIQ